MKIEDVRELNKDYYQKEVCKHLGLEFPTLVSYTRFVELMPSALVPMCAHLQTRKGKVSGISFIDSLPLAVCHNRRIHSHKVFEQVAERGKSSVDWFYGFKLHLIVNDQGELLSFHLTADNVDDRRPVPKLARGLFGKLFGDRGYVSRRLQEDLSEQKLQLITKIKKNMKNRLLPVFDSDNAAQKSVDRNDQRRVEEDLSNRAKQTLEQGKLSGQRGCRVDCL